MGMSKTIARDIPLELSGTVKTYRYLDEEEPAAKPAAKPKKKGKR